MVTLIDQNDSFTSGAAIIGILGPFFKCPPAPFETALMLRDSLVDRGVRNAVTIKVLSPLGSPIPVSPDSSEAILAGLGERGIEFWPNTIFANLDPATRLATLNDGRTVDYHLVLAVPVTAPLRSSRQLG